MNGGNGRLGAEFGSGRTGRRSPAEAPEKSRRVPHGTLPEVQLLEVFKSYQTTGSLFRCDFLFHHETGLTPSGEKWAHRSPLEILDDPESFDGRFTGCTFKDSSVERVRYLLYSGKALYFRVLCAFWKPGLHDQLLECQSFDLPLALYLLRLSGARHKSLIDLTVPLRQAWRSIGHVTYPLGKPELTEPWVNVT